MMRRLPHVRMLMVMASCAILGACSEANLASYAVKEAADSNKAGIYKIGKPYQISGVWYYPAEDYNYSETGVASWYGPDFHGKYTANGEVFDQNEITAAHRTLPMPSFVRVTNLDNGRVLVVRVNDRGPFARGRILDLSRRAAQLLGIEERGTARVHVEIMAEESRTIAARLKNSNSSDEPPVEAAPRESVKAESLPAPGSKEAPKTVSKGEVRERTALGQSAEPVIADQTVKTVAVKPTQLFVQAGAFSRFDNANRMSAALSSFGTVSVSQVKSKSGNTLFRVRLGPVSTVTEADALLAKIIGSGYPDAKLVVD